MIVVMHDPLGRWGGVASAARRPYLNSYEVFEGTGLAGASPYREVAGLPVFR